MTIDNKLTTARQAIWSAVDASTGLAAYPLKKKFKLEDDLRVPVPQPALVDMPALAVAPARLTETWTTNRTQTLTYAVEVRGYFVGTDVRNIEQFYSDFRQALYDRFPALATEVVRNFVVSSPVFVEHVARGRYWEFRSLVELFIEDAPTD